MTDAQNSQSIVINNGMQFLNNKIPVCEIQIQVHREFDIRVAHLKWMSFIFMLYCTISFQTYPFNCTVLVGRNIGPGGLKNSSCCTLHFEKKSYYCFNGLNNK